MITKVVIVLINEPINTSQRAIMTRDITLRKTIMEQFEWELLSPEDKKKQLYLNQKQTLEAFLERGAISKAQFDKSLGDLTEKMGMSGI